MFRSAYHFYKIHPHISGRGRGKVYVTKPAFSFYLGCFRTFMVLWFSEHVNGNLCVAMGLSSFHGWLDPRERTEA